MPGELKAEENISFEEALERLEAVLVKMEKTDCPLEEIVNLYQEGTRLVQLCRDKLADAENKIAILQNGTAQFVPFTLGREAL